MLWPFLRQRELGRSSSVGGGQPTIFCVVLMTLWSVGLLPTGAGAPSYFHRDLVHMEKVTCYALLVTCPVLKKIVAARCYLPHKTSLTKTSKTSKHSTDQTELLQQCTLPSCSVDLIEFEGFLLIDW